MTLDQLRNAHANAMAASCEPIARFPWEEPNHYASWLGQTYYFLRHATRMLCLAAARFTLDRDRCLHIACLDHSNEEKGHEQQAIDDLRQLGRTIQEFPEFPETAQLYQSQYYLIEYVDAAAIFGSVLYLEGLSNSVGPEVRKRVVDRHGEGAANFLTHHVEADVDHVRQAFETVEHCRPEQFAAIIWSLEQQQAIYLHMIDAIVRAVGRQQPRRE